MSSDLGSGSVMVRVVVRSRAFAYQSCLGLGVRAFAYGSFFFLLSECTLFFLVSEWSSFLIGPIILLIYNRFCSCLFFLALCVI